MVRHYLKGFTSKRDPTGIIHSLNARGIKTGRSKRISKYTPQQLTDFASMRRAQTQRQSSSELDMIPPIEPVPEIPTSTQLTPPKEKVETFSFAQPEGEGEEPSLLSPETEKETVAPPPGPPQLGEF